MVKIIGQESGKVYVVGTKAECFRVLQKKYPFKRGRGQNVLQDAVYSEPLLVVKK